MTGVVVPSIRNPGGVFSTDRRADSQLRDHPDDVNRGVWTIGPVAQVLGNGFFATVDDGSKGDLRHMFFCTSIIAESH